MDLSNLKDVKPRNSVMTFARMMELKLRQHDEGKGGQKAWRADPIDQLVDRVQEETNELYPEVSRLETARRVQSTRTEVDSAERVAEEAVDVANMAMMVADNALRLGESYDL